MPAWPPRMRAVSVAKYQPPVSSSAGVAVGDHAAVGEQHRARRERRRELGVVGRDDHRGARARAALQARARARPWRRGPCRASAHRGTAPPAADRLRRRSPARGAGARRPSSRGDVAQRACRDRPARAPRRRPPRRPARGRGSRRVLEQQRDAAGRMYAAARGIDQPGDVAQQRRLAGAVTPEQHDPLARAAGSEMPARIARPPWSSCQTRVEAQAGARGRRPPAPRRRDLACGSLALRQQARRAQRGARLLDPGRRRRGKAEARRPARPPGVSSSGWRRVPRRGTRTARRRRQAPRGRARSRDRRRRGSARGGARPAESPFPIPR